MTCGIYKLNFSGTNKVYVGQAINIEKRFVRHLSSFRSKLASSKMQEAFDQYGDPQYEILVECNETELSIYEKEAISIWDSINNGFNTLDTITKVSLRGEDHGMCNYSNEVLINMMEYLVNHSDKSQKEVSDILGISEKTINLTACGVTHKWLQSIDPKMYEAMTIKKKSGPKLKREIIVIDPEGKEHLVTNIKQFAESHNMCVVIFSKMTRGERKSKYKGWDIKR